MKYKQFTLLSDYQTNCYLLWDEASKEALIIDAADQSVEIKNLIEENGLTLKYILNTHGHGDHIGGNKYFKELYPQAKVGIHQEDAEFLRKTNLNLSLYFDNPVTSPSAEFRLEDDALIYLGVSQLRVIHTPGHTPGGVSLYAKPYLFSGDTLFAEEVGRTDFPGGSFAVLIDSIKNKLFLLPEDTIVLPGHGPSSTIGEERRYNPYVGEL
jgi:glyoxylase-like metal-dependent hydrolase (beta-lactamase superfamily II)